MWKTLEFLYFNDSDLANDLSQKSLHLELHSNNFLFALTETGKQTFEMTGRNSAEALSATRQNTSWNVLNSYGSGRCSFNF